MARRDSRRRSREADPPMVVGIAWYDATQWAKLKEVAADPDQLDQTHEAWQRTAERTLQQLSAEGLVIRRIPINVDALVQWCRANQKVIDGKVRAEYTSLIVNGAIPG
jgi:hypothetical protein